MFRIEKKGFVMPDAEIKPSPGKGRGIYARRDYAKDEIIERSPTLVCDVGLIDRLFSLNDGRTIFHDYIFTERGKAHVGFGWSSIYNHSSDNNAHWKVFNDTSTIEIRARRNIEAGEEITVRYVNWDYMLWFVQNQGDEVGTPDEDKLLLP